MNPPRMNINLHIEKLLLDGIDLPRRHQPRLQASIEAELARLLTDGGMPDAWTPTLQLRAGDLQLGDTSNPEQLGVRIAESVYGSMSK